MHFAEVCALYRYPDMHFIDNVSVPAPIFFVFLRYMTVLCIHALQCHVLLLWVSNGPKIYGIFRCPKIMKKSCWTNIWNYFSISDKSFPLSKNQNLRIDFSISNYDKHFFFIQNDFPIMESNFRNQKNQISDIEKLTYFPTVKICAILDIIICFWKINLICENQCSYDIQKSFPNIKKWISDIWKSFFSCDQAALQMVFSVCPSVCHTFLTMFPSSYHHELLPMTKVRSLQKVKVKGQGHRGHNPT